jgi:hypothetical protein
MKINILAVVIVCGLTTSCSINKQSTTANSELPQTSQEEVGKAMAPGFKVFALIQWYYERENQYPESPEQLVESYNSFTNAPYLNIEDYSTLKFTHTPTNTMMVYWEAAETKNGGDMLVTPESLAQPVK